MTNNEPIHAKRGESMALMTSAGYPYTWDGQNLYEISGRPASEGRMDAWLTEDALDPDYYMYTRPEGVRVLPPEEPKTTEQVMQEGIEYTAKMKPRPASDAEEPAEPEYPLSFADVLALPIGTVVETADGGDDPLQLELDGDEYERFAVFRHQTDIAWKMGRGYPKHKYRIVEIGETGAKKGGEDE